MEFLSRGSIRQKFALLVFLAVLPAIAILLYTGIENRRDNIRKTEKEVSLIAHTMGQVQKELAVSVQEVLTTLALTTEVATLDARACEKIFRNILERNSNYRNISLINLEGDVVASGMSSTGVNLADRKQFRDALASRGFVTGEFIMTRIGNQSPAFPFAYPVLDETGTPRAVLTLVVELNLFSKLYDVAHLPENSFVAVTDHQGVRLFYYPSKETTNPVGKPIRAEVWAIASRAEEAGIVNLSGSDGRKRIIAFEQVRLKNEPVPYMYVWAGVPESYVLASANTILKRNLSLMLLAAIGAWFIAWSLGRRALLQPIQNLIGLTSAFSKGHFDKKGTRAAGVDEFNKLTASFYEMAESLSASQEALKKSEDRFKTLSEVAFEGIMLHRDETVIDVNDSLARLFGYDRREMLGRNVLELLAPLESQALLRRHFSEHVELPLEFEARRENGEHFPAEIESRDFSKDGEAFQVSAIRDLTKRKAIEAQNQQMARLADLGEMATGVAHEINNPISGVIGCAELLKSRLPAEDPCQGLTDRILREGDRIANIVKALLTIAHPGSKEELINIEKCLESVLALYASKLENAGIVVSVEIAEPLPTIKGDHQKLEQVLLNLVSNAYYALNTRFPEPAPEKRLDIRIFGAGEGGREKLCFVIHDQGSGIPKAIIGKIFEPFFTTKPAGSGTGIGLGICHQIVESHGGVIRVESTAGEFTRFTIELPASSP